MRPPLGTGISTGAGSAFRKEVVKTIGISGNWVPPPGDYYITSMGSTCSLQVVLSDGSTWRTILANGVEGFFTTDGSSVRVLNGNAGATEDVEYVQVG
jgi:hypothetical protein